jgi:hypothetical protein
MCFVAALPAVAAAAGTAGATTAAGMTAMQMLSLGASVAGTAVSAYSGYQQSKAASAVAKNNATMAEYAARDAQRRGELEAVELQRKGASLKSAQRANMAAKGLDLGYGTAADLQDQTDFFTQSDVATARTNASKEAWSRRAQKGNYLAEANSQSGAMGAAGTLLAGAGQVADKWFTYRGK